MSDFSKGFILCKRNDSKTLVHNKKSRRNKKQQAIDYDWMLYKFIGMSDEEEMGSYGLPVNNVGNGLTVAFVLNELNKKNCFDFDYQPSEGDNLIIGKTDARDRIEFIFRNGHWIEDHYSPFYHNCEKMCSGKLAVIES